MEERHLNMKKVSGAIIVFVLALFIIIGSALITNNITINSINNSNNYISSEEVDDMNKEVIEEKNQEYYPLHILENVYNGILPKYNPDSIEQVKNIYKSDEKQIYLTFDDGPTKAVTPQILDILKEEQVTATFFVLGSRVKLNPDIVKRMFEEGHYIANHGYSHTYSQIYASTQSVIDEYDATEKAIQEAIGMSNYHSYLFRFPGGSSGGKYDSLKTEAKQELANNGVVSTNWNCLSGDAEGQEKTEEELLSRLYESQGDKTSLIILMHDASDKQVTVNILRQVIQKYKSEGYVFKNFYEIF